MIARRPTAAPIPDDAPSELTGPEILKAVTTAFQFTEPFVEKELFQQWIRNI